MYWVQWALAARIRSKEQHEEEGVAPIMFWRPMGFWKNSTEATITMTRLRQFPMECVTGDTRCRIMYDTCSAAED